MTYALMRPHQIIRRAVRDRLRQESIGARRFERQIGLRENALHGILDKKPKRPNVDLAAEICEALGLEFYVGPPRERQVVTDKADALREAAEAMDRAADQAKRVVEIITRLPAKPKADDNEDASTQTGGGEVIRVSRHAAGGPDRLGRRGR